MWEAGQKKKFGTVAEKSPAFHRIVESLCSKAGLESVRACIQQGIPLHGVSAQQPGIESCHMLVEEMKKHLAGTSGPGGQASQARGHLFQGSGFRKPVVSGITHFLRWRLWACISLNP